MRLLNMSTMKILPFLARALVSAPNCDPITSEVLGHRCQYNFLTVTYCVTKRDLFESKPTGNIYTNAPSHASSSSSINPRQRFQPILPYPMQVDTAEKRLHRCKDSVFHADCFWCQHERYFSSRGVVSTISTRHQPFFCKSSVALSFPFRTQSSCWASENCVKLTPRSRRLDNVNGGQESVKGHLQSSAGFGFHLKEELAKSCMALYIH